MAQWTITYSKDNNTSQVTVEAAEKLELDEASAYLLEWAEQNLEAGEFGDGQDEADSAASRLLRRFGVTVTGITRS